MGSGLDSGVIFIHDGFRTAMARKPRIHIPSGLYPVMLRGHGGAGDLLYGRGPLAALPVASRRARALPASHPRLLLHDQSNLGG